MSSLTVVVARLSVLDANEGVRLHAGRWTWPGGRRGGPAEHAFDAFHGPLEDLSELFGDVVEFALAISREEVFFPQPPDLGVEGFELRAETCRRPTWR